MKAMAMTMSDETCFGVIEMEKRKVLMFFQPIRKSGIACIFRLWWNGNCAY